MNNAEKIELLDNAYDKISKIKEDVWDIYGDICSLPDDSEDNWNGVVAEQIYTSCSSGELSKLYFYLVDYIDTICQEIIATERKIEDENLENFRNGVEE